MIPVHPIMRQTCHELLDVLGLHDDPLLKMALELENIALEDEHFTKKKLYPNVDFFQVSCCAPTPAL